jgi:hypothetical protein
VAKDRTFTFRAGADLGERLDIARELLQRPDEADIDISELVAREFERRLGALRDSEPRVESQSELIRVCIELVTGAAARTAEILDQVDVYAQEPPRAWEDAEWLDAVLGPRKRTAA